MHIAHHPDATELLGAPADWTPANGDCAVLPASIVEEGGLQYYVSLWKPTREELAVLNKGGHIALLVQADDHESHPVVAVTTSDHLSTEFYEIQHADHTDAEPQRLWIEATCKQQVELALAGSCWHVVEELPTFAHAFTPDFTLPEQLDKLKQHIE